MSETERDLEDDLRPEYDFSQLQLVARGKGFERYRLKNWVHLAPDVAKVFPDDDSVNDALRLLIRLAKKTVPAPKSRKAGVKAEPIGQPAGELEPGTQVE